MKDNKTNPELDAIKTAQKKQEEQLNELRQHLDQIRKKLTSVKDTLDENFQTRTIKIPQ